MSDETTTTNVPRRSFLGAGAAAGASLNLLLTARAQDAASKTLNVGLIGCGGRGTGAAVQALSADPNTKLIALADAFGDRLDSALGRLQKNGKIAEKIDVKDSHKFVGFDAYKKLIDSDVDVVVMATPPHFRPDHVAYAAEKGKHMFVEKPVGVDGPGVKKVRDAMKVAEQKGLSVVSGLCWRYHNGMRDTFDQIHSGKIGDVVTVQCTYNAGGLWNKPRESGWSDMEYQMRNWLYYTWLSGDHIVEQAVHSIDKMQWAFNDKKPAYCYGVGGRQSRVDEKYGHIFDHFGLVYDYGHGARGYHFCRQQTGTDREVNDFVYGTNGWCNVFRHQCLDRDNKTSWRFSGKGGNMYQLEHDALFKSIREGKPINNGEYMCDSTLAGIMGRMAAYTGKKITWEMAANSKERLGPETYEWGDLPTPPVAIPGATKFV